jgi:predicted nucleic acid-binding protein
VLSLVDTNILVYRFDSRFPEKQAVAKSLLRQGIAERSLRAPYQAIVEFLAATTRSRGDAPPILELSDARREAEELLAQFEVLYPNEAVLRLALRGCAAYQLSWSDANLWAYAEHFALDRIVSEDFEHQRLHGSVTVINSFLSVRATP